MLAVNEFLQSVVEPRYIVALYSQIGVGVFKQQ